jgi:hypothetical protein
MQAMVALLARVSLRDVDHWRWEKYRSGPGGRAKRPFGFGPWIFE